MSDRKPNRERVYLSDDEVAFLESLKKGSTRDAIRFCIRKEKIRVQWRDKTRTRRIKQRQELASKVAQA